MRNWFGLIVLCFFLTALSIACAAAPPPTSQPAPLATRTPVPTVAPTPPPTETAVLPTCQTTQPTTLRILALGDSYTIGEDVSPADRFPNQLARQLQAEGNRVAAPRIIAKTGWTTQELLEGIETAVSATDPPPPSPPYDLVTLLIGVNDQFGGESELVYRQQFQLALAQAIEFANGDANRVIVLSIPDWGVTPFANRLDRDAIAAQIDQFNRINRTETLAKNIHYVDITDLSRRALTDQTLVAEDRLHPSGAQYADWTARLLPVACQILTDS